MKYLYSFILLFLSTFCTAQQKKIDSLLKVYSEEKVDTLRAKLLEKIAQGYSESNPDKSLEYATMGLELSRRISFHKGSATFMLILGNSYSYKGNTEKALMYVDSGITISKEHDDKAIYALLLNSRANVFQLIGNPKKAAESYFEALKIADQLNDTATKGLANFNIGGIYSGQGDFAKAKEYHSMALHYFQLQNRRDRIAIGFTAIGGDYTNLKDYSKSEEYYFKAIALSKELGNNRQLAIIYDYLAHMYNRNHDPAKALIYILPASELWKTIAPESQNAIINLGNIGAIYLDIALNDSILRTRNQQNPSLEKRKLLVLAQPYLEKAVELCRKNNDMVYETIYAQGLADLFVAKGDYKNAYLSYKNADQKDDSIHSQDMKNEIASVESKYALSLKDKEIEINKLALATQKKQRIGLIIGLCLVGLIGGLFYRQSQVRKRTNTILLQLNNKLDEANKVKAKFFGIISHDLRSPVSKLINYLHLQKEEPGLFTSAQSTDHEKRIAHSAELLLETMEGMLLWSKSQMENFKPEHTSIPVHELFDYIKKQIAPDESIRFDFSTTAGLVVYSDLNYLQTIMQNLTANSIKALQKIPEAKISWKAWKKGTETYLSITDNGPGTNEEKIKALYDEKVITGTRHGLGLHIIRDLAKAIQCKISVQSQPEEGTTFILAI